MIVHQGVYLPDHERHLVDWMTTAGEIVDGKGTYQIKKLRKALSYCTQFRTAVDVGAHCGLWSMQLAKQFVRIHAFEPVTVHQECFMRNVIPGMHVSLHACALGERDDMISINTAATSSGDSWVDGAGDIPMKRLDSFALTDVDFIKIDCEGGEELVIKGGVETIKKSRPIMIVEQKGGEVTHFGLKKDGAIKLLESIGMKSLCAPMSGDWIMGW